jgi:hypothetical protein
LSFGGGGSGGQIRYQITVEDAQAASKLQGVAQQFQQLGNSTKSAAQQMSSVPQTFQTIVQEGNKVTTTTKQIQQTMQGTVTTVTTATKANQSFGDVLKNNVLSISIAASSIIGLVSQYTQLRRAQVAADKAAIAEITTRNRVTDLTNKLAQTIAKYGANSTQAAKGARDLEVAQQKAAIAAERNEVIQASLSERTADFAVNILPNVIGSVGSVIQVLQGFRKAEEVSTVTTIENTGAQVANAAAMKVSQAATSGMISPLKGVAAAEIGAGTAAKTMGVSIKGALIGTGVGAILVGLGTALVAFTQNWWGLRDSVNAAGVELGRLFPILTPLLNGLKEVGNWILTIFGEQVPGATQKAAGAVGELGDEFDATAQDAAKAAEDIKNSFQKTMQDLIVLPGSAHKEWKEQWKKLRDIGFSKGGIDWFKDNVFKPAGIAQVLTKNISQGLSLIKNFKPPGDVIRKFSNDLMDQISKAMKGAKGQLDFMESLKDIIRAHKKDPELPRLVAEWFNGLPEALKAKLTSFGLDPDTIIKDIGFDPAKLKTAISKALNTGFNDAINTTPTTGVTTSINKWFGSILLPGGKDVDSSGKETSKGWLSQIIESIKKGFSPENLKSVGEQLIKGILAAPTIAADVLAKFVDPIVVGILNEGVKLFAITIPDWIKRTFTVDNFIAGLTSFSSTANKFIIEVGKAIFNPDSWATAINTFATNFVGALGAWLTKAFPQVGETLKKIFSNAQEWFAGLLDVAIQVGKTVPSTIAAWINTGIKSVSSTVSNAFNNAVKWFGGLLDAAITVGKEVPQTIANWIVQGATAAATKAATLGVKIGESIKKGIIDNVTNIDWSTVDFGATPDLGTAILKALGIIQPTEGGGNDNGTPVTQKDLDKENFIPKGGTGSDLTQQTQQTSLLARATVQLKKDIDLLTGANNALARTVVVVASDMGSLTKANSTAARTITTVAADAQGLTKTNNTLARTINTVASNTGGWTKANNTAARTINTLAGDVQGLTKANNTAARTINTVSGNIRSLSSSAKTAASSVKALASAINGLKDKTVTIRVNKVGGGLDQAQHGMHTTLMEDTLIQAHKGERVDIGPGSKGSSGTGGGGGGGFSGNIIIENNIMNETIIRKAKMQMGRNRFTFG